MDDEVDDGEVNDCDDRLDRFEPATVGGGCDVTMALLGLLLLPSCWYAASPAAGPETEVDAA